LIKEIELNESDFEEVVDKSELPILVDFWAPWCGPCRAIAPILTEIAEEHSDKIQIGKLNVDENPAVAQQFAVTGIPTLILFKDGNPVERLVGVMPRHMLEQQLQPYLV